MCSTCGTYKGRELVNVTKKLEKKAEKQKRMDEEKKNG